MAGAGEAVRAIRRCVSIAALGCALGLALAGCGLSSAATGGSQPGGPTFTLMQMNLCLSGLSSCFGRVEYPAVLDDAVTRIRATRPDAVTINEGCRADVKRIARMTGYDVRFSRVIYAGKPLDCVRPGGRGLFGDAVLTRASIKRADNEDFAGQAGPERRRWLCVTTRADVDVCTSHLNTRSSVELSGNDAQCAELARVLARRAATARAVAFGGDVNRRGSCAPKGAWTRTDRAARQQPGLQQVYGSAALRSPSADVAPAVHTDHDVLVVRARLRPASA